MKNRHFGEECSWILAGKARKCGRFWVFACVPNPGKQSIWRQCVLQVLGNKARKNCQIVPALPMYSLNPCFLYPNNGSYGHSFGLPCLSVVETLTGSLPNLMSPAWPTQAWEKLNRSGKSKWGLSKWGLKVLVHNCPRLPTIVVILWRKFPSERGPKRPQKCTIVHDCAQIAESGLKPPFESPHLDFPEPGGFQTGVFPIFFGKGPDCVADPFGTVPRRCSQYAEKEKRDESGKSPEHPRANRENPRQNRESPKRDKKGRTSPDRETPPFETLPLAALDKQFNQLFARGSQRLFPFNISGP